MYGWGPDTDDWKAGGYRFKSAKAPYLSGLKSAAAKKGPRTYTGRTDLGDLADPKKVIRTESKNPIYIAVDVTGSMASWPGEIFDRLPLLYQTLAQYRDDVELAFAAIGDATCDSYPLQVTNFAKGVALEDAIEALCPEGRGGGQISESYELFGYHALNRCEVPNATSPFLIIFGDEKFYPEVDPRQVRRYTGEDMKQAITSAQVWQKLLQKFNVYYLQKPYDNGDMGVTKEVKAYWADAIGPQRVIDLPNSERAVDVAMGLIAKSWGEYGDFTASLKARHPEAAVSAAVNKSLRLIPATLTDASMIDGKTKGTMSKPLA